MLPDTPKDKVPEKAPPQVLYCGPSNKSVDVVAGVFFKQYFACKNSCSFELKARTACYHFVKLATGYNEKVFIYRKRVRKSL